MNDKDAKIAYLDQVDNDQLPEYIIDQEQA